MPEMRLFTNNFLFLVTAVLMMTARTSSARSRLGYEEASKELGLYPQETIVPQAFVLQNKSLPMILDRIATPGPRKSRRAIIFTTLRFDGCQSSECKDNVLGIVSSFCYHLSQHGLLQHTMLITTAEDNWAMLNERGLPAYLDRAFPRRSDYVQHVKPHDTPNREFDVQKHWWGWKFTSMGYRVVYMDSDAAVVGNLLTPFTHPFKYDVQGLTDWQDLDHPELNRAYTLKMPCALYRLKSVDGHPRDAAHWIESWSIPDSQHLMHPLVPNPCQSTGVWYLQPTKPTLEFMAALVERIAFHQVEEWDQTAWNDILLHFLWGAGNNEPLKYRALPQSQFANLDTYKARVRLGMRQDQIVLHMGGINGDNKRIQFQELGLWAGNFMVSKGVQQGALPLWQWLATKPSEAGILDFYSLSTWLMVLAFIVLMVLFAHLQHNGAGRRNRIFPLNPIAQRLGVLMSYDNEV